MSSSLWIVGVMGSVASVCLFVFLLVDGLGWVGEDGKIWREEWGCVYTYVEQCLSRLSEYPKVVLVLWFKVLS